MPVTGKLARRLHETLGEEAAEDLVNWMQQVDNHRAELRELNEMNFARFQTGLDERLAQLSAQFDQRLDQRLDQRTAELRQEMRVGFAELRQEIAHRSAELLKWSFVFWVGAVGSIAALAGVLQ
jgi:ABC-type phosphate transport system auxiliary subunit